MISNLDDVNSLLDQISVMMASIQQSPEYQRGNLDNDNPLKMAFDKLSDYGSKIQKYQATPGLYNDDDFARTKAEVTSGLTKNSDQIRDAMGSNPVDIASYGQPVKPVEILNQLTQTQPSQYVDPSGSGGISPVVSSSTGTQGGSSQSTDEQTIDTLGQNQYKQTQDFIKSDADARTLARQQLAQALTNNAQQQFQFNLPSTLEALNTRGLLNSSGLGEELGRQQGNIAAQIANQMGIQGSQDYYTQSSQNAAALQQLQGMQQSGLNRTFSLADYQKQADLSRQLGALQAPQQNGKAGSTLSGIGAVGQPLATVAAASKLAAA